MPSHVKEFRCWRKATACASFETFFGLAPLSMKLAEPLQRLDTGLRVEGRLGALLVVDAAAELGDQRVEHEVRGPGRGDPERVLDGALVLQSLHGGLEPFAVLGQLGEAGLLQVGGVSVEAQRVDVQRDAVALVLVDAGVPDDRREVVLGELEAGGDLVERHDDPAGGARRQLVDVHDADVGTGAGRHRGWDLRVVVGPLQRVHRHRHVGVVRVELLDHLLHEGAVTTGEAVPEGQRHLGTVVLVALTEGAAGDRGTGRGAPAPTRCERGAGADRTEGAEEQTTGQDRRRGAVRHEDFSFVGRLAAPRCRCGSDTPRACVVQSEGAPVTGSTTTGADGWTSVTAEEDRDEGGSGGDRGPVLPRGAPDRRTGAEVRSLAPAAPFLAEHVVVSCFRCVPVLRRAKWLRDVTFRQRREAGKVSVRCATARCALAREGAESDTGAVVVATAPASLRTVTSAREEQP